jgi:hypothetical protein
MILSLTVHGQAATVQEVLNAQKLTPATAEQLYGNGVYYEFSNNPPFATAKRNAQLVKERDALTKKVAALIKGKATNYEKLVAIFKHVASDKAGAPPKLDEPAPDGYNCVWFSQRLNEALSVAGFTNYPLRGFVKAADGGWTVHSWNAIEIGGQLFFLDAFMTSLMGKSYFLISQNEGTMYRSDITIGNGIGTRNASLSDCNTAAKRKQLLPIIDPAYDIERIHSSTSSGSYNMKVDGRQRLIDLKGNIVVHYPDKTYNVYTLEEYVAAEQERYDTAFEERKAKALEEAEAVREQMIEEALAEREAQQEENRQNSTEHHRHRNPDGTYGPWEEGPYDG